MAEPGTSLESQALRGVREAWDELIARHDRTVMLSLVARGLTPEKARDLAQSAWIRLVEQQGAGRLQSLSLPGLAIAQASFLAREEARHTGLNLVELNDAAGAEAGGPDPEVGCLSKEQAARAVKTLRGCSTSAQTLFHLAYGEDLAHAEIARRVGLSLQRVRQSLCEVRKRLREAIEDDDG